MRVASILCLMVIGLGGMVSAQVNFDAAIFNHAGPVLLFDTGAGKVTSIIPQAASQAARGGCFGPTGYIYLSAWTTNGIDVLDPTMGQWIPGLQVKDSSNLVMGAPYTPCPNYENLGGFGLMCVDGNPAPTSLNPPANSRNTFVVDYSVSPPAFRTDGFFPNTNLPMSDWYPNPHGSGFIGVGFATNDLKIDQYPIANPPLSSITLTNLCTSSLPIQYDATIGEDGLVYAMSNGFMLKCDTVNNTVLTIKTSVMPASGYCGMWAEPWELPGMAAYVAHDTDDTVYKVDLLADPMVAVSVVKLPAAYSINSARDAQECQLCSWRADTSGKRNFHVNFGGNALGQWCTLAPSLSGLTRNPLNLNGLDIHLGIDTATILALSGFLPYTHTVRLGTAGDVDILWNGFGSVLGISCYWQAVTYTNIGVVTDVSNVINVEL